MPNTIKALSLWQPWASLVAIGAKSIETRHWSTHYRGPIAIHAAKRWTREEQSITSLFRHTQTALPALPPLGAIVAVGRLAACEQMTAPLIELVAEPERTYGHYTIGRWMWMLEDVVALGEPVPYRGRQGLFDVPVDALPEEARQLIEVIQ